MFSFGGGNGFRGVRKNTVMPDSKKSSDKMTFFVILSFFIWKTAGVTKNRTKFWGETTDYTDYTDCLAAGATADGRPVLQIKIQLLIIQRLRRLGCMKALRATDGRQGKIFAKNMKMNNRSPFFQKNKKSLIIPCEKRILVMNRGVME